MVAFKSAEDATLFSTALQETFFDDAEWNPEIDQHYTEIITSEHNETMGLDSSMLTTTETASHVGISTSNNHPANTITVNGNAHNNNNNNLGHTVLPNGTVCLVGTAADNASVSATEEAAAIAAFTRETFASGGAAHNNAIDTFHFNAHLTATNHTNTSTTGGGGGGGKIGGSASHNNVTVGASTSGKKSAAVMAMLAPPNAPYRTEDYSKVWHGIRVRVGLHFGFGEIRKDEITQGYDYFGTIVNTAARVEGVGHGGQTLITEAVLDELVGTDNLNEGTSKSAAAIDDASSAAMGKYAKMARAVTDTTMMESVINQFGASVLSTSIANNPFANNSACEFMIKHQLTLISLGPQALRGLDEKLVLYQLLPKALAGRRFPNLRLDVENVVDDTSDSHAIDSLQSKDDGGHKNNKALTPPMIEVLAAQLCAETLRIGNKAKQRSGGGGKNSNGGGESSSTIAASNTNINAQSKAFYQNEATTDPLSTSAVHSQPVPQTAGAQTHQAGNTDANNNNQQQKTEDTAAVMTVARQNIAELMFHYNFINALFATSSESWRRDTFKHLAARWQVKTTAFSKNKKRTSAAGNLLFGGSGSNSANDFDFSSNAAEAGKVRTILQVALKSMLAQRQASKKYQQQYGGVGVGNNSFQPLTFSTATANQHASFLNYQHQQQQQAAASQPTINNSSFNHNNQLLANNNTLGNSQNSPVFAFSSNNNPVTTSAPASPHSVKSASVPSPALLQPQHSSSSHHHVAAAAGGKVNANSNNHNGNNNNVALPFHNSINRGGGFNFTNNLNSNNNATNNNVYNASFHSSSMATIDIGAQSANITNTVNNSGGGGNVNNVHASPSQSPSPPNNVVTFAATTDTVATVGEDERMMLESSGRQQQQRGKASSLFHQQQQQQRQEAQDLSAVSVTSRTSPSVSVGMITTTDPNTV